MLSMESIFINITILQWVSVGKQILRYKKNKEDFSPTKLQKYSSEWIDLTYILVLKENLGMP